MHIYIYIYLHIWTLTNTYIIACCFSPMGENTVEWGDLSPHIGRNLLQNTTQVPAVQQRRSGNVSCGHSRVICTISQSRDWSNPSLEPPALSCQNKEMPGWELHPGSDTCPWTTNPSSLSRPHQCPGTCPQECPQPLTAPRAQGWGDQAMAPAFSQRLLTHVGYWSHNHPASGSECQSGLSFDQRYNQIQHSSMDY